MLLLASDLLRRYLYAVCLRGLFFVKFCGLKRSNHVTVDSETEGLFAGIEKMNDYQLQTMAQELSSTILKIITDDHDLMFQLYWEGAQAFDKRSAIS